MGKIHLNNIKVFAYHGCLIEESKIGSEYYVNLTIEADLSLSAETDNLSDTVDYVHLNKIVKDEMAVASHLLETVADRILNRILSELKRVQTATVAVSKVNPPLGGDVAMVTVERRKKRS